MTVMQYPHEPPQTLACNAPKGRRGWADIKKESEEYMDRVDVLRKAGNVWGLRLSVGMQFGLDSRIRALSKMQDPLMQGATKMLAELWGVLMGKTTGG